MTPTERTPPHILLVDDDRLILATLVSSLSQAGYQVSSASSAEEAEGILADARRPDLVVLDVRMPGQSGLQLSQRLRELDQIPFIMFSAYSDEQTVQQAVAQGALSFLVKPMDAAQLLPAVEAALARAQEIDGLRETRKQLQTALDGDRTINLAVGITMMQYRLSRQQAFEQLRRLARSQNARLADLALALVNGCESQLTSKP